MYTPDAVLCPLCQTHVAEKYATKLVCASQVKKKVIYLQKIGNQKVGRRKYMAGIGKSKMPSKRTWDDYREIPKTKAKAPMASDGTLLETAAPVV